MLGSRRNVASRFLFRSRSHGPVPRRWAGHALDCGRRVSPLRMQRVHVEMLESFRSAVISEVASSLASLQVAEEGGFGERLPANTTGSLEKSASRPCLLKL